MRIIGGQARGRRILSVPKAMREVRPISGRIRQSLFDIIRPRLPGARFLDLFAGTGAVGLEALSRGAELVVFVDRDKRCLQVIEKNVERAGWKQKAKVLRGDVTSALSWVPYRAGVERFDLMFMGPPYKDVEKKPLALTGKVLANVAAAGLLEPEGWIVAQHHAKEAFAPPAALDLFRCERYGDSRLSFLRLKKPAP